MNSCLGTYDTMGIPDDLVRGHFIRQYQRLAAAKANGSVSARGTGGHSRYCVIARDVVDGRKYAIDDLLEAYRNPLGPIPILPHPLCQMLDPGPDYDASGPCGCCWSPMPAPKPGADPKFVEWMEREMDRHLAEVRAQGERAYAQARSARLHELHAQSVAQLAEAEHGELPWPDADPLTILASQGIDILRQLQRKYGVRGFRTKIDIARQLLELPMAMPELETIFIEERAKRNQWNRAHVKNLRLKVMELAAAISSCLGDSPHQ